MTQKDKDKSIQFNKNLRVRIDGLQIELEGEFSRHASAERTLAKRALQQARHWLGEDLHLLGNATPYPNGINPANNIVDAKADVVAQVPVDAPSTGCVPPVPPPFNGGKPESLTSDEQKAYDEGRLAPGGEIIPTTPYPSTTPVVVADGRFREEAGQDEVVAPSETPASGHRIISGGSSR